MINSLAIYVADTIGIVLCIVMLTTKSWKMNLVKEEKKTITCLICIVLFSLLVDPFSFICEYRTGLFFRIMAYFANYWVFFTNVLIGSLWLDIVILHTTGKRINKFQIILSLVMFAFGSSLLISNAFTPIVFSLDENNVYQRGPLYLVFAIIEGTFVIDGVANYLYSRKKNPSLKYFPVLQFLTPVIIGLIIQTVCYGVSTMLPFLAISICAMLFGFHTENEIKVEAMKEKQKDLEIIYQQKLQLESQQQALKEAAVAANAANAAKTAFLNNMSHDIRTPMNAIIGYTGLVEKHIKDEEQVRNYLGKIEQSSNHLLSLINDVLDMSRIESGKMKLFEQNENISDIVKLLGDIVLADVSKKDLHLTVDTSNATNKLFVVDKLRLNQILLNILSNSIKYTNNGGNILFKVSEEIKDGNVGEFTFVIKDDGIGMSKEFIKTIYDPFTRVNSSAVSGIQGTGLGMAITKKFIDMMNGTIDIQSEEGKGTETTLKFNFNLADEVLESKSEETIEYSFKGKKVLLVEDNEMNREIACEILSEDGFIVDTAEDGTVAVDKMSKANAKDYDLILMDVQMPKMNGYEATKAIRGLANKDIASITIIAMTANAFEEDKKEALESGMNDYISKPIDVVKMKEVLAKYLN